MTNEYWRAQCDSGGQLHYWRTRGRAAETYIGELDKVMDESDIRQIEIAARARRYWEDLADVMQ